MARVMIVTCLAFMLAFLLSLILVAVNIGQIITMVVPLINAHATPDSVASSRVNDRVMKCGVGAEATAVSLHTTVHWSLRQMPAHLLPLYSVLNPFHSAGSDATVVTTLNDDLILHHSTLCDADQGSKGESD